MKQKRSSRRMEVWFADLGEHPGTCVQEGIRPVLVVSNNIANQHAKTVSVLSMTSRPKKSWLPSHVSLCEQDMIMSQGYHDNFDDSLVLLEQITTIDKTALRTYVGWVKSWKKQNEIAVALAAQLGPEVCHAT